MNKANLVNNFVIGTFVILYLIVSIISTIHVINFFSLSNPYWLSVSLAIAFEVGAAASLASLIALDKMNKGLVWALFITITIMQMQGNMYYAFTNLKDYNSWVELFNLVDEDPLYQKRVLSFVSGAILPLVALGFIKSLVDYIKPEKKTKIDNLEGPTGNNGPDDSTLNETPVLAVDPTPSVEEDPYVEQEISAEPEIEVNVETKEVKEDIIKTEKDFNNFLDNSNQGGLVNSTPRPRVVADDNRPTGFEHPGTIRK